MDASRYAELFLTESRDNLSAINHSLLELERNPDAQEHIGALFRAVHTVKGMSATMGYTAVAELAHELETVLDVVRHGDQRVTPEVMDLLFRAADALELAIELSVNERGDEVDLSSLTERLRQFRTDARTSSSAAHSGEAEGDGLLIRVVQVEDTPLRGVRAYLVVQRAAQLGTVTAVSPPVGELHEERYGREFSLRLVTSASDDEIQRGLHSAGGVERVWIERPAGAAGGSEKEATTATQPPSPTESTTPAASARRDASGTLAAGWASETAQQRQHRHVRIDLQRLDTLMNLIGELVITRGRLVQLAAGISDAALDDAVAQASRLISDLRDGIMTSRMVPMWQVFDRFPRVVRDAGRALGKQIEFIVEGKDIELDRSMLDEIGDPIVHLLRNAIDHGIETPDRRRAVGKPGAGRLTLSASRDRSAVVIRVTDDGRGIDRDAVLARARDSGLIDATKSELTDDELVRLISKPGFSTATQVTDISGRGVGIDAVFTRVRALGGSVEIRTAKGQGTTVTARLPVTLAIVRALLARVGDETFALPMTHVNETVHMEGSGIKSVKGREVLVLRDDVLPLLHLRDLVRLPRRDAGGSQVVVLEVSDRRAGLVVDELTGQQEIVVKPFDSVRDGLPLFSGATILGDGAPALILDVSSLL